MVYHRKVRPSFTAAEAEALHLSSLYGRDSLKAHQSASLKRAEMKLLEARRSVLLAMRAKAARIGEVPVPPTWAEAKAKSDLHRQEREERK